MALAAALAVAAIDTTTADPQTTASFTPTANSLLVICVCSRGAATHLHSVTGSAGEPVTQKLPEFGTAAAYTASLWVCKVGASPVARTITADVTNATATGMHVHVIQWTGQNLTATDLQSVVQAVGASGSGLSGTVALAAPNHVNDRPGAHFFHGTNELHTPRTSWTELSDAGYTVPTGAGESQVRTDAFEQTASASWATTGAWIAIAYEVLEAAGTPVSAAAAFVAMGGRSAAYSTMQLDRIPYAIVETTYVPRNMYSRIIQAPVTAAGQQFPQALAVAATFTPVLVRQTGKVLALTATFTMALVRRTGKILALGLTGTVVLLKQVSKLLPISATYTVLLAVSKVVLKALAVSVTYTVAMTRRTAKVLALGVTYTALVTKRVGKGLALGLSATVSASGQRVVQTFQKALSVALNAAVSLVSTVLPSGNVGLPVDDPRATLIGGSDASLGPSGADATLPGGSEASLSLSEGNATLALNEGKA